jgi:type IV pilus assembly protein PilA
MKKFMGKTMAKMNENRRNGRRALKGFTLVEIIVVLVILAILAAAMIPALTGYLDKAKDRTIISEARNAVTAAQTIASESYGVGKLDYLIGEGTTLADGVEVTSTKVGTNKNDAITDIKALAEVPGTIKSIKLNKKCKVTELVYISKENNRQVTYKINATTNAGEFTEVTDYTAP